MTRVSYLAVQVNEMYNACSEQIKIYEIQPEQRMWKPFSAFKEKMIDCFNKNHTDTFPPTCLINL